MGLERLVELLLQRNDIQVNKANMDGQTPIHLAALRGYHNVVEILLKRMDTAVNQMSKNGLTPLYIAPQ